jgi:AAA15 family ATPase/GTPase
MLIEFEVGNFLSFKDPVRLSMVAANPIKEYLEDNTCEAGKMRLLKSAVIYGANASGKSNLINAIGTMRLFVLNSSKDMQASQEIGVKPFKFDAKKEKEASHFEIFFLLNDSRYRYGFEADRKIIQKEWLFCTEKQKESTLFLREGENIDVREGFKEGGGLEEKTRSNALFLSVVAQFNGAISVSIVKWFSEVWPIHGLFDSEWGEYTKILLQNASMHKKIIDLITFADVGIMEINLNENVFPIIPAGTTISPTALAGGPMSSRLQTSSLLSTRHKRFNQGIEDGYVNLDFATEESEGTKKLFSIVGPILRALNNGNLVYIDELDAKLHPLLTRAIVRMFNSRESNPKNAQLVFATHDTNLLQDRLRRDQIWFTEKNNLGATDLYSLAEFKSPEGKKVRSDDSFERSYIKGKYGAIPYLGNFEELFKSEEEANGSAS